VIPWLLLVGGWGGEQAMAADPPAPRAGQAREARRGRPGGIGGGRRVVGPAGAGGKGPMLRGLGAQNLKAGRAMSAAMNFRQDIERTGGTPASHVGLGRALAQLGRCEEALEELWPYVGAPSFSADAALAAAVCSGRFGLYEDALVFDEMALERQPDNLRALTNLALDSFRGGDAAGYEAALDRLLVAEPGRDASLFAQAVVALQSGDFDELDFILLLWQRQDRRSGDIARLKAQAWLDLNDPQAALDALEGGGARVRSMGRAIRAESWRRLGLPDVALAELDRHSRRMESLDADAVRLRAYVDLGEQAEAAALMETYMHSRDPDMVASEWYACDKDVPGEAAHWAALYDAVNPSAVRTLAALAPIADH
jgi:tetratricopeptide (TPR) repeat protein